MTLKLRTKPGYFFVAADNLALLQLADQIRCWSGLGRFPYFLEICSLMRYIVAPETYLIGLDEVDGYKKFPTNIQGNERKIRIFLKIIGINLSLAFNEKHITLIWSKYKVFCERWVFSLTNIILANTVQKLTCNKLTLVQYVPFYGNKFDQCNGFVLVVFEIETYGLMIYFCVLCNQHNQRNFKKLQ